METTMNALMMTANSVGTPFDEQRAWVELNQRDPRADFFYGVTTTGIFCRPDCASRRPLRQNTRFFLTTDEALAAGFRPCLRCHPNDPKPSEPIANLCAYLEQHLDHPVRLSALGKLVGLSPFTVQRLFRQRMGVSPAQYQRALRASALREQLHKECTVTEAIYEAGYGSSSRAYEKTPLAMTPTRFIAGGRGENIRFAVAEAPGLGWMVVGCTKLGICWLAIASSEEEAEAGLRTEFAAADIAEDADFKGTVEAIIAQLNNRDSSRQTTMPLDLRGTAFQLRVWQALQQIPLGETRTYGQLAAEMGIPSSTRAVARACALNRVSVLVPCHRVIGASGSLTGYRWGVERKRHLLASETR